MSEKYYAAHITMDHAGNPLCAFLLAEDAAGHWYWLDDTEFAPFDTRVELAKWLTRALAASTARRDGKVRN